MHAEDDDLRILRALCQTADPVLLFRACRALRSRAWARGEHLVVFEACAVLADCGLPIRARQLAAQLTRAGFPDVDLDALFAPLPSPDRELLRLLDAPLRETE